MKIYQKWIDKKFCKEYDAYIISLKPKHKGRRLVIFERRENMKAKKLIATAVTLGLFLTACGSNGSTPSGGNTGTPSPSGDTSTGEQIVLKYAAAEVTGTPEDDANLNFIKTIEEKSNGRIKVEYYNNSQLGNDKQVLVAAMGGTLDIVKSSAGNLMDYSEALAFTDLPGLFKSQPHVRAVFQDEDIRSQIAEQIQSDIGLVPINYDIDGGAARALFYNRAGGVAKVPSDMKGVKLRTTGSEIEMALFDQWGASSVPMNFNEVYLGLSQGTVEGLYGHPIGTYGNKLCEVTDYCTIIDMSYVASVQLMSASCIEKLGGEGSELYNIVMEAGKELELYKDQLLNEKLETIMDEITAEGVEVYYPNDEEIELWRESGQAVWGDYVGDGKMVSQDIVDKVLAIGEEF